MTDSNTTDDEKTSNFTLRPKSSVRRAKQIKKNSEAAKNVDYSSTLGGEKDASADTPEWAKALKRQMEQNADRIDTLSKQTGSPGSQQLGKAARENKKGSGFTLDPRKTRSTSADDDQDSEKSEKSSGFTLDPRGVN